MRSFADVLALWPSLAELAADLGLPYGVVKQWRFRDSVPAPHWKSLVSAAQERGHPEITADLLAELANGGRAPREPSEAAE